MKPIIFSSESVRAILDGRKTQTRRVAKNPKDKSYNLLKPSYPVDTMLWVRETFRRAEGGNLRFKGDIRSNEKQTDVKWTSPIFMPKWASRIKLEVTKAGVNLLQNISEKDAIAEGVGSVEEYKELWDKINKKRGFDWNSNPYVWVYEFKKIERLYKTNDWSVK